tara:strand:+ start:226 stop:573 length:348 start_codon:yes stop_codon:yes gene_type:complete
MIKKNINYKNILTQEEYNITRKGGTEAPYSGKYCAFFEKGLYLCKCCNTPLFSSDSKYNSGGGWPDFTNAINKGIIDYIDDYSSGQKQTEVKCSNCNAHLGHVFNDGPPPNYKRY